MERILSPASAGVSDFCLSEGYVLFLHPQLPVISPGQADRVVEFIDPSSELAKTIDKEYWVKKEVERKKYRPKDVVAEVRKAGFTKFKIQPEHLDMWKGEDAKNPAKGFGADVAGAWYWYQTWVDKCLELCKAQGEKYK